MFPHQTAKCVKVSQHVVGLSLCGLLYIWLKTMHDSHMIGEKIITKQITTSFRVYNMDTIIIIFMQVILFKLTM